MDLWNQLVNDWRDNYGRDSIKWKTTVGIGDSMYGMNIAYMRAFVNQKPTKLQIHYHFPENYYYHFEDPESVDYRVKHINKFYMWKDIVDIEHIFDSQDFKVYNKKYFGVHRRNNSEMYRYWSFDPTLNTTSINKKIVLWRPTFNAAQQLSGYKLPMLDHEWQRLIDRLTDFGYDVTEIGYRTPISEAVYHIRTAECCISYEGMWHYIAKNFFKPHIVFSNSNITKWHTPAALWLKDNEFFIDRDLKNIEYMIESATEKANNYKHFFNKFVNGW
jgi:hypothetical protein